MSRRRPVSPRARSPPWRPLCHPEGLLHPSAKWLTCSGAWRAPRDVGMAATPSSEGSCKARGAGLSRGPPPRPARFNPLCGRRRILRPPVETVTFPRLRRGVSVPCRPRQAPSRHARLPPPPAPGRGGHCQLFRLWAGRSQPRWFSSLRADTLDRRYRLPSFGNDRSPV